MTAEICRWCQRPFSRRHRHGSAQTFCASSCRTAFHTAARRWAEVEIAAGTISVADLKSPGKACTPAQRPQSLASIPKPDLALLRGLRRIVLHVPMTPDGVADLLYLGWLAAQDRYNPAAVAVAVVDVVNSALERGLRPTF
jgi:hypothetical protein